MPDASVIIVTRNRREQVRRAILSALAQVGDPEIIVVDDASEDGTADAVRTEFPTVRVHRSNERRGYVSQRNLAAQMSEGTVVFSLDDDAEFSDPQTVQKYSPCSTSPVSARSPYRLSIAMQMVMKRA